MNQPTTQLKEEEKSKLEEELTAVSSHASANDSRANHPHCGVHGNWIPGLVLILVGVIFLAANLWEFHLDNWWALFILIPAFGNFNTAYEKYRRAGHWTRGARSAAGWGFFFVLIATTFLFNISWSLMWPVLLILLGLGFLLNNR
jgi:hypothetical protein